MKPFRCCRRKQRIPFLVTPAFSIKCPPTKIPAIQFRIQVENWMMHKLIALVFVDNRNPVISAEKVTATTEHPVLQDNYHIMDHVTVNEAALCVGCEGSRLTWRITIPFPTFYFLWQREMIAINWRQCSSFHCHYEWSQNRSWKWLLTRLESVHSLIAENPPHPFCVDCFCSLLFSLELGASRKSIRSSLSDAAARGMWWITLLLPSWELFSNRRSSELRRSCIFCFP